MYSLGLLATLGLWSLILIIAVFRGKLDEKGFKSILPSIIVLPLLSWIGFVILLFSVLVGLSNKSDK